MMCMMPKLRGGTAILPGPYSQPARARSVWGPSGGTHSSLAPPPSTLREHDDGHAHGRKAAAGAPCLRRGGTGRGTGRGRRGGQSDLAPQIRWRLGGHLLGVRADGALRSPGYLPPPPCCRLHVHSHLPHDAHRYLTVDRVAGRDLFYMLAEHEGNTTDRTPLLLWTQGCASRLAASAALAAARRRRRSPPCVLACLQPAAGPAARPWASAPSRSWAPLPSSTRAWTCLTCS